MASRRLNNLHANEFPSCPRPVPPHPDADIIKLHRDPELCVHAEADACSLLPVLPSSSSTLDTPLDVEPPCLLWLYANVPHPSVCLRNLDFACFCPPTHTHSHPHPHRLHFPPPPSHLSSPGHQGGLSAWLHARRLHGGGGCGTAAAPSCCLYVN